LPHCHCHYFLSPLFRHIITPSRCHAIIADAAIAACCRIIAAIAIAAIFIFAITLPPHTAAISLPLPFARAFSLPLATLLPHCHATPLIADYATLFFTLSPVFADAVAIERRHAIIFRCHFRHHLLPYTHATPFERCTLRH